MKVLDAVLKVVTTVAKIALAAIVVVFHIAFAFDRFVAGIVRDLT